MTEVEHVIQNPPADLHKLFVRFSEPKSFNIFRIFDEYERLHAFGSHAIYNIRWPSCIGYTIISRPRLEFVYSIQHGRECCK